jgi:FlaA1/EpsC-like NDP-sugar epimerase
MLIKFFRNKLTNLSRIKKQLVMIFVDSILVILALLIAFSLRLEFLHWPKEDIIWLIFASPILAVPIFIFNDMYHSMVRFIGSGAFLSIFKGVTIYALAWGLIDYLIAIDGLEFVEGIPRSVLFINWMLCFIVIGGSRAIANWLLVNQSQPSIKNVIIYGAGSAGMQLSNALKISDDYNQMAYVDDDQSIHGNFINGFQVFKPADISYLAEKYNIKEILLALPSCSRKERQVIIENLSNLPLSIRSLPSVSAIAEGKVRIEDLLGINIQDLLGRELVKPDLGLLRVSIKNKVVLVTGAGGSIGSELSRQIVLLSPKKLILFDISESSLYLIQQEISSNNKDQIEIISLLGSVRSFDRLKNIFTEYGVETIYHAAAYKHVPLVEFNQSEAVLNNIIGTMNAAKAAIHSNVETFVLISTDKAVRPTNTMGATKRVSELVLQALSKNNHNTCFTMVRFGNVLDSSGSVVPLFKKQIKEGGPITVTDANVVRYFMTIPEAVELVIQAGAMADGGDVFVLDMGKPVLIYDLALKMIHLSGLKLLDKNNPHGDIEIIYTGLRPGEKLYEELLVGENSSRTKNKLIMRAEENFIEWGQLEPMLNELKEASRNFDNIQIRDSLIKIVPEFNPLFPGKKNSNAKSKSKINK